MKTNSQQAKEIRHRINCKIWKRQKKLEEKRSFYFTDEWMKVRYLALKKYGRKCSCCGSTPKDGSVMHVDHIKPRSTHPSLELDINNLQILCKECNLGKRNYDSIDWRDK